MLRCDGIHCKQFAKPKDLVQFVGGYQARRDHPACIKEMEGLARRYVVETTLMRAEARGFNTVAAAVLTFMKGQGQVVTV